MEEEKYVCPNNPRINYLTIYALSVISNKGNWPPQRDREIFFKKHLTDFGDNRDEAVRCLSSHLNDCSGCTGILSKVEEEIDFVEFYLES